MKAFPKNNIIFIICLIGLFTIACQSEKSREERNSKVKVQNLETFARLYGYARWFHPSDEAQEIDWEKFAVLGIQKIENIKSPIELRDTLYRLFSPIVQGLQIYDTQNPEIFNTKSLLSPDPNAKPVAWQHYGVCLNDKPNPYKSIRTYKNKINEKTTAVKYFLDSSELNGKKIKFSGYFKTSKGNAKLFIQPIISSNNNKKQKIHIESYDWKKYELILTIPKETKNIIYGFEIEGNAEIWADKFEFAVNNNEKWILTDTTNMGFEKIENEINAVNNWNISTGHHKFEVTDKNPFSGKYSLKAFYTGKMFDYMPQFGEITKAFIGNNLICVVPLTLLTNESMTYPKTKMSVLTQLQSEVENVNIEKNNFNQQTNLASVIITWNVLQHFFPYFDVINVDWNKVLKKTLENTLNNTRKKDFFITISQMIAQTNDGHGIIFGEHMYNLPIRTELIENKIVITASNNSALKKGDIIKKIDGKSVMEVLDEKEKIISGSPQLRRYRALNILGSKLDPDEVTNNYISKFAYNDPKHILDQGSGTHLVIERDEKEQNLMITNSNQGNIFLNPIDERKYLSETIIEIEPGIYYINMAKCTMNEFEQKIEVLVNAKAVIYDQRGGNCLNFSQIIPHWIVKPVTSTQWNVPLAIYPDREKIEFDKSNWNVEPKRPLFKSKSIIINVPSVVSKGETMMDIIDHYNLATTIGEPTGGCNGNINVINMPCGYYAWFTGMKVLKHDSCQLYLIGFKPDYPVNKTIQAIKEGRDEYLEKALEIARQESTS